jgi:hypothetical protein
MAAGAKELERASIPPPGDSRLGRSCAPVRSARHHSASAAGLIGNARLRPGEMSLCTSEYL